MIYLTFLVFTIASAVTEFPCNFPSPWTNQTFSISILGLNTGNWQFNTDCQTSIFTTSSGLSQTWLCHQITERFLVVRVQGSDDFACFPIFYNLQSAPLMFTFGSSETKTFVNKRGEFTDICEVCKMPVATAEANGSPASSPPSKSCDIPSMCPLPGKTCSANDVIPNSSGCPNPTLITEELTSTTPEPTTTTPEPSTTTPEPRTTITPETTTTTPELTTTPEPSTTTPEPTTTTPEPTTTTPEPSTATSEPTTTTTPEPTTTTPEPTTTTPEPSTTTSEPTTATTAEPTTTTPKLTTTTPEPTTTSEPITTTPELTTTTHVPTTTSEPKTTTHGYRSHCRNRNPRRP